MSKKQKPNAESKALKRCVWSDKGQLEMKGMHTGKEHNKNCLNKNAQRKFQQYKNEFFFPTIDFFLLFFIEVNKSHCSWAMGCTVQKPKTKNQMELHAYVVLQ